MAPTDSCGCDEGVLSSRRGFGFPVVGRGSSSHGDGDVGEARGDLWGSSRVVTAWSRLCAWCVCS